MLPGAVSLRNWYARFERPISSASLVGGFVFDALTLKQLDLFWENFWVVVHLVVVATCIILINLQENEALDPTNPAEAHFWYINILQFFFGGLLSTFLVFYFRSATLSVTWPFLLVLLVAFVANESLKKHYARLTFQVSLFYLSLLAYAVFIVPVFFHRIGTDIFVLSGLLSLITLGLFVLVLRSLAKEKFIQSKKMLSLVVAGIYLLTNALYLRNLIPPIPLSLKDGGVYHSLVRNAAGNYVVESESRTLPTFLTLRQDYHLAPGEPVYAYSAIFSPASFSTTIFHEWQQYQEPTHTWVTTNLVGLAVKGGRSGGYRTYSVSTTTTPGKWRVNVETADRKIIGRLRFDVLAVEREPALQTEVKS